MTTMNFKKLAELGKDKAIELSGGPASLSRKMGLNGVVITRQGVAYWSRVPIKHLILVSTLSGVPVRDLVPEIQADRQ